MKMTISVYPHQQLFSSVFFIVAVMVGMNRHLVVVLICVSLMVNDVEHLFISVGHLYVFFGKMSIQVLCPFFNQLFFWC